VAEAPNLVSQLVGFGIFYAASRSTTTYLSAKCLIIQLKREGNMLCWQRAASISVNQRRYSFTGSIANSLKQSVRIIVNYQDEAS